jgi:lysine 2,3-aminomutase
MAIRVSPYILSLIDWDAPLTDPIRTQFVPLGSRLLPDHPKLGLDSLHERADMPVPGLTHRYPDKALFLALDTCPVYCRFCTRSYAVGLDTDEVQKFHLRATRIGGNSSSNTSAVALSSRISSSPAATPISSARPDHAAG